MSTVPQTVGKSGRQKMRNDFHSGFESRVTVGNNNNTKKVIKITKNNKVSNDNKIIKKMRNYFCRENWPAMSLIKKRWQVRGVNKP